MLSLVTLFIGAVLAWLAYRIMRTNKMFELSEKLPGPPCIPLLGNTRDIGALKMNVNNRDFLQSLVRLRNKFGSIFRLWLGSELFIFVSDPKYVETILSSSKMLDKGNNYKFLHRWLGAGLLTSSGPTWRKHRKIISPTFHFKILEGCMDVFNANSLKMVQKLQEQESDEEFNINPYVTLCALDIICETAMGVNINAQDGGSADFVQATREMGEAITKRTFQPWLQPDLIFCLSDNGRRQKKSIGILHEMTDKIIKQRKEELAEQEKRDMEDQLKQNEDDDLCIKKRRAFLDMMLEASKYDEVMSIAELREEVHTFMFEGHDMTTSGISFILSSLSHNQDIQDRVVEELESIFGDSDRDATYRDIQEMKYLELVVKESQRMFPSLPMYVRNIKEDIEMDGYTLPKGANVSIVNILMHRDANFFPDPEKFDPERFTPENCHGRNPYQYVPFSAGPRNCIGQKFAMLEMKTVVSKVLRSYKLLPGSTTNKMEELVYNLVLKNVNGARVRLVPRRKLLDSSPHTGYQGRQVTWRPNVTVFSEFDISSDSTVLRCQARGKYRLQTSKNLLSAQPYHPSVTSSLLFTFDISSDSTVLRCQPRGKYHLQTSKNLLSAQPYRPSVTSSYFRAFRDIYSMQRSAILKFAALVHEHVCISRFSADPGDLLDHYVVTSDTVLWCGFGLVGLQVFETQQDV
uniref:Cytochrome P450 n=1 Tax=Timema genevievae TaxID=629358 RepID=A0A7R9JTL5_TIMGE|nr:unnamed protein product [Timema genevievae]